MNILIIRIMKIFKVTVYEKSGTLGGQWNLAAVPPSKQDFTTLVAWQRRQMEHLGVEVKMNTDEIDDVSDIIVAVGSASNQDLYEELKDTGIKIVQTGDAKDVKQGIRNIEESYYLGWSL